MKRLLLASTSVLGAGMLANPALAADGIKLGVGGFFKSAYMVVFDDDSEGDLGNEHNTDGFFSDAEIHFTGSTVLDNGLEVGARIELEGENTDDQIDEAWIYFSGGFGEIRIGSDDEALANSCIVPPGGTGNFSAFSPNQWGANAGALFGLVGTFGSNSICTGVDDKSDAQKIIYITPSFSGFQLTVSYTPDSLAETHDDGAGPHLGMTTHALGTSRHNFSAYGTYTYEGEDWGVTAGAGGSWAGHAEEGGLGTSINEKDFYQAGINLTLGDFGFGIGGEYFNDVVNFGSDFEIDTWVLGAGASYAMDAWIFGLQYSHRQTDVDFGPGTEFEFQQDRIVATANYALGPGIAVDGEIGYSWIDTDPELDGLGIDDDYDAVEIGIGTNITF